MVVSCLLGQPDGVLKGNDEDDGGEEKKSD